MSEHDWAEGRLDDYLDGVLPASEAERFVRALQADPVLDQEFRTADRIQRSLRSFSPASCPPEITRAILSTVRAEARRSRQQRLAAWLTALWQEAWRPALAAATLVAIVVLSSVWPGPASRPIDPQVAQATAEVKWTLAYLSEMGRNLLPENPEPQNRR